MYHYRELLEKIIPKEKRILEIGPLCNPIISKKKYKNVFYADIRSTDEVKKLYSDNDYLQQTGIKVDLNQIVEIDFVLKNGYKKTFEEIEKFDYLVASNVIEHIPNFLDFFTDISNVLKPNGKLVIIYPDKRFCFDHYRESISFRDVIANHIEGVSANARLALDFSYNVVKENNPYKYWNNEYIPETKNKEYQHALENYNLTKKGKILDDVHYWPVTDYSFLKLIKDLQMANLFEFSLHKFGKTLENTQEFLVILNYENKKIIKDSKLDREIKKIKPDYISTDEIKSKYNNKINLMNLEKKDLLKMYNTVKTELENKNCEINRKNEILIKLGINPDISELNKIDNLINNLEKKIEQKNQEINGIYNSKSWRYTQFLRNIRKKMKR